MTERQISANTHRLIVVCGLGLGQLIAFGCSLYLLTALGPAIVRETGWPLSLVVAGYSIGLIVSAGVSHIAGRYVGAGYGHNVLALSSVLFTAGLLGISFSHHYLVYAAAWGVMGLAMGSGLYDAAFGTVGRLFGPTARNNIIQIALWGGFASTTFWPLSAYLEHLIGWRGACQVFAAFHLLICLPIYLWVIPRPQDATAPKDMDQIKSIRAEGPEKAIYIALGFVLALEMSLVSVMSVHMHALLHSRGVSLAAAVSLSAFVGPSQVAARLLELSFGKRWAPHLSLVMGVVGVSLGIGLIAAGIGLNLMALILYGAGLGIVSITSGTVPLAIFGPVRYPPLVGRLRRISLLCQAIAPVAAAWLMGQFGINAMLGMLLVMVAACLGVSLWLYAGCQSFLRNKAVV
jgi:hypothetical protein